MRYWAASMASITAKTLFWSEEKCEGKRGLSLDVRLDFIFTWFGGLTGRSEAVRSKYLILWFNALFKGTEEPKLALKMMADADRVHTSTGQKTGHKQNWHWKAILQAC